MFAVRMLNEEHIKKRFGKRIKQLREEREWSQVDLSHQAELDPGYISKIERGIMNPSLVYIHTLAEAFGMTASELLNY